MAKGAIAKEQLINKIIQNPEIDFIGEYNKKYYFWSEENGEKIQIAVSLTCPKNPVAIVEPQGDYNFEDDSPKEVHPISFEPAEITQEEKDKVAELIEKLGL